MRERIWMVVLLLIMASISSVCVSVTHQIAVPLIEKNRVQRLKKSVLKAFHIPYQGKNAEEVFQKKVTIHFSEENPLYVHYTDQGKPKAIAFQIEGSGFSGPIRAIIALKPDLETIQAMIVLEQRETPGLGGRIMEPEFLCRFEGKKIKPKITLVSRRRATKPHEVQAITGATMSSKTLERIVNQGVEKQRQRVVTSNIMEGVLYDF